ncbi:MAG: Gfo/Idh/MocA family oxidoreductase [Crocinitomicaceae bacterium]|nr:Gfo/Idh/MocA family oxidoreductase [Crocinitomicaceae bacterium]
MLKIGLFGAGHLGKIHLQLLLELESMYELVGFFDPDDQNAYIAVEKFGLTRFKTPEELMHLVDCIDIVTPTLNHFEIARVAIRLGKHIFIEKPITETLEEGEILVALASEGRTKIQVGHVERFNPSFIAAKSYLKNPMFIETHRLAQFNPRGTDVPVVLDLMIHDIDIILSVVRSRVRKVSASGVAVVSDSHDIANARIEFENGCVANLTASRISMKNMRKSRFFQRDAYVSVDFLQKELEVVEMEDILGEPDDFDIVFDPGKGKTKKKILFNKPDLAPSNAIKEELISFYQSITEDTTPVVSGEDGLKALEIAYLIIERLKKTD